MNDDDFVSDPPGTRYIVDGEGNLIRDRRPEPESGLRRSLVYGALLLLLLLAGLSVLSAIREGEENDQREIDSKISDFQIRDSQRTSCENSANVLRQDIRTEFITMKEAVLIPVFTEVAASIPPSEPSAAILDQAVGLMERRIETIDNRIPDLDCADLYPLLDDPRTEKNERGT